MQQQEALLEPFAAALLLQLFPLQPLQGPQALLRGAGETSLQKENFRIDFVGKLQQIQTQCSQLGSIDPSGGSLLLASCCLSASAGRSSWGVCTPEFDIKQKLIKLPEPRIPLTPVSWGPLGARGSPPERAELFSLHYFLYFVLQTPTSTEITIINSFCSPDCGES